MAFPTSPTNGQITVVNNVSYQYSNVSNSWTRILSTANLITANTVVSNGLISAVGNISGNYIFGNGSQLTGITLNPGNISNGTSNVSVVSSGGNVTVGIGGTSNIAVFATTGEYVTGIISASGNIISAANITGGNILTAGLVSITGTLSVSGATTLANLSAGNISSGGITSGGAVSAAGNVTGGNLLTGGLISATSTITSAANITGGNLLTGGLVSATGNIQGGNLRTAGLISATSTITSSANITGGNLLTGGLISSTGTVTGSSFLGAVVSVTANITGGNILTGGLISATANITGGNLLTAGQISATGTITSNGTTNTTAFAVGNSAVSNVALGMFPTAGISGEYAIRDYSTVFSHMYLDVGMGGTANGAFQFRTSNAFRLLANINSIGLTTPLAVSATGNVTGAFFIGNGSQLTGVVASAGNSIVNGTSNVVVAASGNVTVGVAGTDAVATFTTAGIVSNSVSATNNGAGTNFKVGDDTWLGDINLSDTLSIRGQQNAANAYIVFGNADSTALGRAGSGPLTYGGAFSATGNIQGGNLLTGGLISATSTVTGSSFLGAVVSVTANITGGNLLTGGLVSATANVTGGNLLTAGIISATGAITSASNISLTGNIVDAGELWVNTSANGNINLNVNGTGQTNIPTGILSVTGNIQGGNLRTAGLITATGNIQGGNIRTAGLISATGTISSAANIGTSGGNILAAGYISATGNMLGGNLRTAGLISATGTITGSSFLGTVVSVTANVTGGNILTGGLISATSTITSSANITGGNLLTGGLASVTGNVIAGNVNTSTVRPTSGALTLSTASGAINLNPTGNVVLSANTYINNLASPAQAADAATKSYVDNLVSTAISYHDAVFAATTTTLATTTGGTITYTQPNGVANGVGALLTTTGSFNLIDTANVQTLDTRILVKNEANAVTNGIYTWANATNIVRSTDADEYGAGNADALGLNDYFFVTNGNVNAGSAWIVDAPTGTITFGTSNIAFAQFSSSQVYTANNSAGLSLTGTVFSAKVDNTTTAFDGTGNIIVKASAALTTPNIGAATGTSLSVTANVTGGNLTTGGLVTATGNVTGGNLLTAGLVSATGTITGTSHLGAVVSVTANVTGGNLLTGGLISATSNVTGGNILTAGIISATGTITSAGNLSLIGNIVDTGELWINTTANGNINLNPNGTGQTNIPAGILSVTGNIQGGNLRTVGQISATGNITGNFYIGNGAFLTGLSAGTADQIANGATSIAIPVSSGNIAMSVTGQSNTVVINLGSLTMYGTFAGPKTLAANVAVADSVNALLLGPVTIGNGYNISVPSNSTLSTYGDASPDIVGATLTVSGNITGGNVLSNGRISATGNILTTGLISATANITGGNVLTSGLISATGNITGNNIFTGGDILPTANATANIGGSSFQYNTIFAKATSAQYADLAENYEADANYEPGTVVCFGGAKEVTVCNLADCISVAGVVSTNPSYLMNSGQTGEYVAAVALQGRVPTKVTGQIRKGDLIVSAGDGRGRANNDARAGTIIGKALVNSEGDAVIEVVVGRD